MLRHLPVAIKFIVILFFINIFFLFANHSIRGEEGKSTPGEKGEKGEKLFKANCSGCHLNGQNLIKPEKPVIGSLKLKSKEIFKALLENPAPPMPKFKNITSMDAQLNDLYNYVTSLMAK